MMRYVWAAPATAVGLGVLAATARGARIRLVDGVIEAHGPAIAWTLQHATLLPGGAAAITLGHVVLARDASSLDATRAHERVHVQQYEVWGPLFLPAYVLASVWVGLRGRHFYFDNPFERQAIAGASCPGEAVPGDCPGPSAVAGGPPTPPAM